MFFNKNKTANIKGKNRRFTMTCKVDYTGVTQLKLQNKKKVILHGTTMTFWRCIAQYDHLLFIFAVLVV